MPISRRKKKVAMSSILQRALQKTDPPKLLICNISKTFEISLSRKSTKQTL